VEVLVKARPDREDGEAADDQADDRGGGPVPGVALGDGKHEADQPGADSGRAYPVDRLRRADRCVGKYPPRQGERDDAQGRHHPEHHADAAVRLDDERPLMRNDTATPAPVTVVWMLDMCMAPLRKRNASRFWSSIVVFGGLTGLNQKSESDSRDIGLLVISSKVGKAMELLRLRNVSR
jgi:hypothetical protein